MRNKSRTFYQTMSTLGGKTISFELDFLATTIDGREVYEVRREGFHYGYMTPELLEALEKRDTYGEEKINKLFFDDPSNKNKMNQKIILDLPKHYDFSPRKISLHHTEYSKELGKTLTIKVANDFRIKNQTFLEFDLNNSELETQAFFISNMDNSKDLQGRRSRYNLNFQDNIASSIIIEHMGQIKDINLALNMKKEGSISIRNSSISLPNAVINVDENLSLEDSNFSVQEDNDFMQDGNGITLDCGTLFLKNTNVHFKADMTLKSEDPKVNLVSVKAHDGLYLLDSHTTFMGENKFNQLSISDPQRISQTPIEVLLCNVDAKSDIEYVPFNKAVGGGENLVELKLKMSRSMLDNKDKIINLSGDIYIADSSIENNGEGQLNISSINMASSTLKNVSSLFNAYFYFAHVENLQLLNKNYKKGRDNVKPFYFGATDSYSAVLKNSSVELGPNDCFCLAQKTSYKIENCNFYQNFSCCALTRKTFFSNSSFSNAYISLFYGDYYNLSIKNSEINGEIRIVSLEEISNSVIKQGMRDVNGLKKIINSYIENETINANYVKNGSLEGYNSNKNIYSGEALQKASKSTEDLEIL
jgi:hypothetical protein